jgi:hypothetical protein
LFVLIWLLGYELLPFAHVALHAQLAPHTHGAVTGHCHGGVCHEESSSQGEHGPSAATDPLAHGQHSLEHRGVAALTPDLTVFVAELTLIGETADELAPGMRAEAFVSSSPPARGPPA